MLRIDYCRCELNKVALTYPRRSIRGHGLGLDGLAGGLRGGHRPQAQEAHHLKNCPPVRHVSPPAARFVECVTRVEPAWATGRSHV
jgi:hypothetical protein